MRNAFAAELTARAAVDDSIVLLSGDIGNRLFDGYKEVAADRFLNCGVAEANMVGMAAGMALNGLNPFAYTITPFITTRCLEQIRVDVCYHNVPVTLVGTGAGFSYANLGPTHHSCEDIAFLTAIPNMSVVCPADPLEVRAAVQAAADHPTPVYIRLGKKGEPNIHDGMPSFEIGTPIPLQSGSNVALLATGNMVASAVETSRSLERQGISCTVVSFHSIKPLDGGFLQRAFQKHDLVVTIEEHSVQGGLGSAVASWLVDQRPADAGHLLRIGTPDEFVSVIMDQSAIREHLGLTPEGMSKRIMDRLAG